MILTIRNHFPRCYPHQNNSKILKSENPVIPSDCEYGKNLTRLTPER